MSETTCPVLFPTEEEFRNFYHYINTIEAKYPDICICKIVPPKSWKARKDYNINKIDLNITYPVKQSISGRSGIYSVTLFELKTFTLQQFYEKSLKMEYKKDENNFKERERQFWRSLGGTSGLGDPIYGADVEGTLFTSDISHPTWNLNNLENLLNIFHIKLPGINTPMMYIGSWRAMFAWHVEDMDLYSINYLHYGACKSWYSIPPSLRKRFETFMNGYYPAEYSQCKDYLRHKTQLVSPTRLREQNIPYQQCVQHPGEFVITFPGAYHSGFNHGFNIAEATNFATERWIQIGIQASFCNCRPGSVTINMEEFETYYLREKKRLKQSSGGNIRSLLQNNNNTLMKIQEIPFNDPYEYFVDDTVYDDNNYFNEQEDRVRCVRGVCTMVMIPPNYRDPLVVKERERLSYYNSYYDCYCCDSDNVEHYTLQQCNKCDLYYHPQCIIDTFEQDGYDLSYLKDKICHVCYFIDSSDVFRTPAYDEEEGNSKKNKSNKRKKRKEEEINQSYSSSSKVKNEGKKPRTVRSSINRKTLEDNNDDEEEDLWFQDNSIQSSSIKPSARFSSAQPIDLTNDDDPLSDLPPVTAKIRPSSSSQTLQSEDDEEDELSSEEDEENSKVANNLSYLNAVEKTKKAMTGTRRKSKEDSTTTFKIGDKVKIKLIGHSKSTIGRIVAIEGKYGKFHIPNRSSQEDTWHPLNEFQNCNDPNGNEESDDNDELKGTDEEQRKIIEGPKMNYVVKPINYSATQKMNLDRYDSLVKTSDHTALQSDLFFLHRHLQDQSHINNSTRLKWMKGFAIGKVLSDHVQKQRRKVSSSLSSANNTVPPPVNLNLVQAKAIFLASSKHETVPSSTSAPHNPPQRNLSTKIKTTPSTQKQTISGWPQPSSSTPPTTNNLKYTLLSDNNTAAVISSSKEIPSSLIIPPKKIKDNETKTTEGEEIEQILPPNPVEEEKIDEEIEEEVIEDDTMIPIEKHVRHNRDEKKEKLDDDDNNHHENEDEDEVPMMNDVAGVRKEDIINFDEIDMMNKPSAVRVVSPEESRETLTGL